MRYLKLHGIKPPDWFGPEAAFYHSFDDAVGLVLWEGTVQVSEVPLVPGKVLMFFLMQTYHSNVTTSWLNVLCDKIHLRYTFQSLCILKLEHLPAN